LKEKEKESWKVFMC